MAETEPPPDSPWGPGGEAHVAKPGVGEVCLVPPGVDGQPIRSRFRPASKPSDWYPLTEPQRREIRDCADEAAAMALLQSWGIRPTFRCLCPFGVMWRNPDYSQAESGGDAR